MYKPSHYISFFFTRRLPSMNQINHKITIYVVHFSKQQQVKYKSFYRRSRNNKFTSVAAPRIIPISGSINHHEMFVIQNGRQILYDFLIPFYSIYFSLSPASIYCNTFQLVSQLRIREKKCVHCRVPPFAIDFFILKRSSHSFQPGKSARWITPFAFDPSKRYLV